jgi:hypothetical protein
MTEEIFDVKAIAATSSLATREAAKNLFDHIRLNENLAIAILDFSSITFISRSFADQLLKEQVKAFNTSSIVVQLLNVPADVLAMIDKVSATQQKTGFDRSAVPVVRFADAETLNNFLVSI